MKSTDKDSHEESCMMVSEREKETEENTDRRDRIGFRLEQNRAFATSLFSWMQDGGGGRQR